MYICPTCSREFSTERGMSKHLLECWRDEHPYHQAKSAPRSEDVEVRKVNDEVLNFFNSFRKE